MRWERKVEMREQGWHGSGGEGVGNRPGEKRRGERGTPSVRGDGVVGERERRGGRGWWVGRGMAWEMRGWAAGDWRRGRRGNIQRGGHEESLARKLAVNADQFLSKIGFF